MSPMSYLAAPPRDPIKYYTRGSRESQEKKQVSAMAKKMLWPALLTNICHNYAAGGDFGISQALDNFMNRK